MYAEAATWPPSAGSTVKTGVKQRFSAQIKGSWTRQRSFVFLEAHLVGMNIISIFKHETCENRR